MGSGYCPMERLSYIVGQALCLPFPQMGKYLSDKEETESERQLALAFSVHISYIFIDKYFLNLILI